MHKNKFHCNITIINGIYKSKIIIVIVTFILFLCFQSLYSYNYETNHNANYDSLFIGKYDSLTDYKLDYKAKWTYQPGIDIFFRKKLKWESAETADKISDFLIYGVSLPSIFITPTLSDRNYSKLLLVNLEVFAVNSIVTFLTKQITARERPGIAYGTYSVEQLKADSYMSFFSGHASYSFSTSSSGAYILSDAYPNHKTVIWITSLSLAAFTSYLRIAADKHYFTDVITGAIVGTAIGYLTPYIQRKTVFPEQNLKDRNIYFNFSFCF